MPWFASVAVFSAVVNILYLTSSVYMLQVYDRVLSSRSVSTLVGLSLLALAAYLLQGQLDGLRMRMLARVGAKFDEALSRRVFQLVARLPLIGAQGPETAAPLRDLDQVRGFLGSLGPTAFFDMPFLPIFLAATFFLHPYLGWLTLFGAVCIVTLTLLAESRSKEPVKTAGETGARRQALLESSRRNAEALAALGMQPTFMQRFLDINRSFVADSLRTSDVLGSLNAFAKTFRFILQSASLGLGAYLAVNNEISGGTIIAASILTSRALAPIEVAVGNWKGFVAARLGYRRLCNNLALVPEPEAQLSLPAAHKHVEAEQLVVAAPGTSRPLVEGAMLRLVAGDGLGLVGPTGSGKSSLARALVGVWRPTHGTVRIDGATLDQWGEKLGRQVGYLPQDVELFEGTIAQNIARFLPEATDEAVIKAAQAAEAHDMILQTPLGYATKLGEGGASLSGGQRQRIGLARALFGNPFLVVLDEPNANLDGRGDEALAAAILAVRDRGGIVVVITHRPSGLASVNKVAVMKDGRIVMSGLRDEVMRAMSTTGIQNTPAPQPISGERAA
ncbi:type I secretion system permease/ATPase [Aureimonas leprariae]|uniref:Type I secretion system permease/ATPase n=2 Tax=Plantimonas leprariae TaxID=2615207 RepID=A0A7V7PM53_9HYPH|nr:type I secretion system permease/ATPase [Aureimonas leprariae]